MKSRTVRAENSAPPQDEPISLLSVIVPVYNAEPFLPRCLESLIHQTHSNLEIICVNDGSTDGSAAILDEYAAKDSRIKVIHQENAGVSVARNRGLDAATGEFLTFVDADDWVEAEAYEKAAVAMSEGVDLVCFGSYVDGDVTVEKRAEMEEYQRIKSAGSHPVRDLISKIDIFVWDKVFRRLLIEEYGIHFAEEIVCGEDAAFYFCYAGIAGNVHCLPEKLYHYVQHGESAMARFRERTARGLDHLRVMETVHCFYEKNEVMQEMQSAYDRIFALYYSQTLETTPEEMHPEVHRMAYALAVKSGAIQANHLPQIRQLKGLRMSPMERLFHWYTDNRECFGFRGQAICSITYEAEQKVYRVFGKRVKTVCIPERA